MQLVPKITMLYELLRLETIELVGKMGLGTEHLKKKLS